MEMALVYKWINFVLFGGTLFYFLRVPIRDFLGDRRENIRKELDELRQQRQQMELRFSDYRRRLEKAGEEIKKLTEELRHEGALEKQNLVRKSEVFAQKIREDAKKIAAQELAKAKRVLQKKTVLMALELAKQKLQAAIQTEDQERLNLWAIQNLERLQS